MSKYFPEPKFLGERVKVELDLFSYATKADIKNATGVDTSSFAKKTDLVNLKVVFTTFLLVCSVSLKASTCETRKNVFYFTLKYFFVLE